MALPLVTAKAVKKMPQGPGTYGSKRGRPAKKKNASQKPAAKKAASKKLPPAFLKNMKKKGSGKK